MKSIQEFLDELRLNSLKVPDRNPIVAPQADLAKKIKSLLNKYETKKLGDHDSLWNRYGAGHSLGDLFIGESPELLDDISYGKNPFTSGGRTGYIPIPDKRLLDTPVPIPTTGGLGVIKNKGGNWLTGSVENALKGLKRGPRTGPTIEDLRAELSEMRPGSPSAERIQNEINQLSQHIPINSWIDSTLTKYVKNRMATPDDEVRKLADQGILHFEPRRMTKGTRDEVIAARKKSGFPIDGMADNHVTGTAWEDLADSLVRSESADRYVEYNDALVRSGLKSLDLIKDNPWLSTVDPNSPVYDIANYSGGMNELAGYGHLIDELLNATRTDSGLPMNLRMKPEGFKGLSMEEAVRKVHSINKFRAEQAKKVNERFAQAEGIPVYKDYGDGTRLLEYKLPDEPPKGYRKGVDEGYLDEKGEYWPDSAITEKKRKQLESWLKQEGDTMGHCVGGYCDAVTSGRSRILSLRDKEGKSRATIELRPGNKISPYLYLRNNRPDLEELVNDQFDDYYRTLRSTKPNVTLTMNARNKLKDEMASKIASELPEWRSYLEEPIKDSIVQIKGPGNRPPDPDVLPYIQDFVRSGNWSEVGDLHNLGLQRLTDYKDSVVKRARDAGIESDYLTDEEIMKYLDSE